MSLGLLNNIASIYAQNNLNQTQSSLQNTLEQLSSGSRINSGADDATGLAVANGLQANVSALNQSTANISSGIGLLQTADGALSQVTSLLNRATTLATEAANGTLNNSQVSAANSEYQNILTQINDIGSTTNFNGNAVFISTSSAKSVFVSDGTSGDQLNYNLAVGTLGTSGVGITAPGTVTTTTFSTPIATGHAVGAPDVAKFSALTAPTDTLGGGFSLAYAGGAAAGYTVTAGSTLAQAVIQLNGEFTGGSVAITASAGSGADANKLILTGASGASNTIVLSNVTLADSNTSVAAGAGANLATLAPTLNATTAPTVLTSVTAAIQDVAYQRGIIGAGVNQLTSESNVTSTESVNLTSAESDITSTNYGTAASDLAKYQVLSQTGISALAQANSVQQEVLKLLQ